MTKHLVGGGRSLSEAPPSLLPFDPAQLMKVRLLPAELARAFEVSKTTVSRWEKDGLIARGPDGRIDPYVAARRIFEKADPRRMRARIFREAMQTQQQLRRRIVELEAQLDQVAERTRRAFLDQQYERILILMNEVTVKFDDLVAAQASGDLENEFDRLVAEAFYPDSPDLNRE